MFRKTRTLNAGIPGTGSVNVFEYQQCEASEKIKSRLTKEDYDATKLDRRFKSWPRESPLYGYEEHEWIWEDP